MKRKIIFTCFIAFLPLLAVSQNLESIDNIGKQKFLQVRGSLSISSNFYFTDRENRMQNPFRYALSGTPVLSIYGFDLPLSFTFANQNFNFSGPSNFQRIGLSPYYKWVKVHAGYRNIAFSPYTLNNHNFLGGGVELTPGKFRFGFVYGIFNDAVAEDTLSANALPASYKRTGYAFKLGYGTQQNFVDVSVLYAKDDPNSIERPLRADISPGRNLSLGLSMRQTILKNLTWELHGGSSIYSEDILATEINLSEVGVPNWIESIYQPDYSTRINFAGHTNITYRHSNFSLKAEYMRIDPEYQTMGSYFFNNDLERYTISPTLILAKGKVSFNGSFGLQRDNLLNNKAATTNRTIGSANLQWTPAPQFSINSQYSNYATQQQAGLIDLNDTLRVFQINHNLSLNPTYTFIVGKSYHSMVLSLARQQLEDRNIFTSDQTQSTTNNINYNYRLQNNQLKLGFSGGLNYMNILNANLNTTRYGFTVGANKELFERKFKIRLQTMYNIAEQEARDNGYILNSACDITYLPHQNHSFTFRAQSIANRTHIVANDYIINLNYNVTF